MNNNNHTYEIRNCANNKEVKSLVNAQRLKPYYDPNMRPTNPAIEHENEENELDPDEIESGEIENQNQANDNNIPDQRQNLQQPAEKTKHPTKPERNKH